MKVDILMRIKVKHFCKHVTFRLVDNVCYRKFHSSGGELC